MRKFIVAQYRYLHGYLSSPAVLCVIDHLFSQPCDTRMICFEVPFTERVVNLKERFFKFSDHLSTAMKKQQCTYETEVLEQLGNFVSNIDIGDDMRTL